MIVGVVTADREATINLVVIGPTGRDETVEAVIDTGFDGYLALPPAVIARLELPWRRLGTMMLGDGSTGQFDVHEGGVIWDDQVVRVAVEAVDICPLVGMALLANYELKIEVRAGGRVIMEALPCRWQIRRFQDETRQPPAAILRSPRAVLVFGSDSDPAQLCRRFWRRMASV